MCVLFTSTLWQKPNRVIQRENLFYADYASLLWASASGVFFVNETHINLEKTTSSVLSVIYINLMCLGFGCWNPEFASMNLPSFRATYLFLCRYSNYSVPIIFLFLLLDNFNFSTMCLLPLYC